MGKLHKDSSFFLSKAFSNKKKNKIIAQNSPAEYFKKEFIDGFNHFKSDADALSRGHVALSGGWKDLAGYGALTSAFTVGGASIGALAAIGVIAGTASLGIGLGIALIAIGAEVGYIVYRSKKKDKEFKRTSELLDDRDFDNDINKIADLLASIYQNQLSKCSYKHAERLATSILKGLMYEMLKNKHFRYSDLLRRSSLQAILLSAKKHIPKENKKFSASHKGKYNMQSAVSKPALYCKENDMLYTCGKSRPAKYGVLYFETRRELKDYRAYVNRLKNHSDKWDYSSMISTEEKELREHLSLFNKPENDKEFGQSENSFLDGISSDDTSESVTLKQ